MAGMDHNTPIPTEIKLHQSSRLMEIRFSDGAHFNLPYEFLRVWSPSAEVRGHGPGQETLQTGKRNIEISNIEAVGNYAVRPVFSDGHDSGLFSWDLLHDLGSRQDELWQDYLDRLETAGESRDVDASKRPPKSGGCGGGGSC
ncbi:MAG: DUF971 domain-containing protein [Rhodocyclaceae bacterium]|nr:DUF971 domain-containing protein [Rhodocyclaceae bacterium]